MPPVVYCAGPLFNPKEQEEMAEIAAALEAAGLATFLPQRDGFELARLPQALEALGVPAAAAARVIGRAIFALDVSQVIDCDATLLNLNGRVPDEGAMVEAGIAFSHGRPLAIYKSDVRSIIAGEDNPLVVGLADFRVHATIEAAVADIVDAVSGRTGEPPRSLAPDVARIVEIGRALRAAVREKRSSDVEAIARAVLDRFPPV